MTTGVSEEQFSKGMAYLSNNELEKAVKAFESAYNEDKENAKYMSFYGMCSALRWGEIGFGIDLCTKAVKKEFYVPEHYINLARVYMRAGNKKGAIIVLKKGLRIDPENDVIHEELVKLGVRKRPIIPFLNRSNPVNRFLGAFIRKTIPDFIDMIRHRQIKDEDLDKE